MKKGAGVVITAVPIALRAGEPVVLTDGQGRMPSRFLGDDEEEIRTVLESLLITHYRVPLACAEQLATRLRENSPDEGHLVEISYLVTMRTRAEEYGWVSCYNLLPWEDQRTSSGNSLRIALGERLLASLVSCTTPEQLMQRRRILVLFALDGHSWRPELALERCQALLDGNQFVDDEATDEKLAEARCYISVAHALAHLRKYLKSLAMPVELMPERFTIPQFQASTEGLLGEGLDRQAFRRQISTGRFLEETGGVSDEIFGRPARLFRFRSEIDITRMAQCLQLMLPLSEAVSRSETIEALLFSSRKATPPDQGGL